MRIHDDCSSITCYNGALVIRSLASDVLLQISIELDLVVEVSLKIESRNCQVITDRKSWALHCWFSFSFTESRSLCLLMVCHFIGGDSRFNLEVKSMSDIWCDGLHLLRLHILSIGGVHVEQLGGDQTVHLLSIYFSGTQTSITVVLIIPFIGVIFVPLFWWLLILIRAGLTTWTLLLVIQTIFVQLLFR